MAQKMGQYVYHPTTLPRWGFALTVAEDALGVLWYPIRPLCRAMGLDAGKQTDAIAQHSRLKSASSKIPIPFGPNLTNMQRAVCLPYRPDRGEVSALADWLMQIDATHVKLEARGTLEEFQYDVLAYATKILFAKSGGGVLPEEALVADISPLNAANRAAGFTGELYFQCERCGAPHCVVFEGGRIHVRVADESLE
jgi:hypothetical protein